ncbi:MAG: DUF4386 domain-containing protein, partial [Pseudomonadota bacterium]
MPNERGLSPRTAALVAGFGLLTMTLCAPFAFFKLIPASINSDDMAATIASLQTNPTPYLIALVLLFTTYVMDIVVAWGLYWLLRADQPALSLLTAWLRLIYTCLAFIGLFASVEVYELATATEFANSAAQESLLQAKLLGANAMTNTALMFFGVHLLVLGLALWRSTLVPLWAGVAVVLAGISYITQEMVSYINPDLDLGWLLLLALG